MPIKLYLRRKRRDDQAPVEEPEPAPPPRKKKDRSKKQEMDVSKLPFKTTITDDDLRRGESPFESELWKDL